MESGSHAKKLRLYGILVFLASIATGLLVGAVLHWKDAGLSPPLAFAIVLTIAALLFLSMVPWWRRLDHMQKDAQYVSWYWGGLGAATAGLLAFLVFSGPQSELTKGACIIMLAQTAGYLAFWLYWRLRTGGGGL